MEFIIGILFGGIVGLLAGMITMALVSADRIRESDSLAVARTKSLKAAEDKVKEQTIYANKFKRIVKIVEHQEQVTEPTVYTIEKIKNVIKE